MIISVNILMFTLLFLSQIALIFWIAQMGETHQYLHGDLTEKIIGGAMKVHRYFGLGFPEAIYQRALIIEFEKLKLKCQAEVEKDIYYEGQFIAKRRLDLLVEGKVLIELKAISELDKASHNKIINYLRVFKIEVGLLLNFGTESLQYKRFVNTKMNQ